MGRLPTLTSISSALATEDALAGWTTGALVTTDRHCSVVTLGPSSVLRVRVVAVNDVGAGVPTEYARHVVPDAPVLYTDPNRCRLHLFSCFTSS